MVGLFTGQVFSKRQADALLKAQQERYDHDTKLLERLWQDEKAARERLEQVHWQQTILANRVGAVAERVAERAAPRNPDSGQGG